MLASTSRSFSLSPSCFFFVQPTCPISESAHEHASRPLRASCSPVLVQSKRISRRVSRSPSLFFNDSFSLSCIYPPPSLSQSFHLTHVLYRRSSRSRTAGYAPSPSHTTILHSHSSLSLFSLRVYLSPSLAVVRARIYLLSPSIASVHTRKLSLSSARGHKHGYPRARPRECT